MRNTSRKNTKFIIWALSMIISLCLLMVVFIYLSNRGGDSWTPKNSLRLPKSKYGVPFRADRLYEKVYVLSSGSPSFQPILIYNNQDMDEKHLMIELNILSQGYEGHRPSDIVLMIDDDVEMQYVSYLRYAIQIQVQYMTLYYAVVPDGAGMNYDYYTKHPEILYKSRFWQYPKINSGIRPMPRKSEIENIIQINQDSLGRVHVDGVIIGKDSLLNHLKTIVLSDSAYMMFADIDKSVHYSDYMKLYNAVYGCFYSIRNDLALEIWQKPFQELSHDKQWTIQKKRPFAYIEEYEVRGNPFENIQ